LDDAIMPISVPNTQTLINVTISSTQLNLRLIV
jgi:hypothetical protein